MTSLRLICVYITYFRCRTPKMCNVKHNGSIVSTKMRFFSAEIIFLQINRTESKCFKPKICHLRQMLTLFMYLFAIITSNITRFRLFVTKICC